MTVHINKTKDIFRAKRNDSIAFLKRRMVSLIMNKSYFDYQDYKVMRDMYLELLPLTPEEEIDILIDIRQNKRFFSDGEDF